MRGTRVTPHERRVAAVAALHAAVAPPANDYAVTMSGAEIAVRIRELAPLSRAPRWRAAVERWAAAMEQPGLVQLTYLQEAVHFGYATEGL